MTPLIFAVLSDRTETMEYLIDINDGDKVCLPHSLRRHKDYNYCYVAPDIFFYYRMG